jgi:chromosome partitioning protein
MIITVTSRKGGVGKSTTAMNLAIYFSRIAPTLLIDGDVNKSITKARTRGKFPFAIAEPTDLSSEVENYRYIIVDTKAQPNNEELETLAHISDLIIIPTLPNAFAIDGLLDTIEFFNSIGSSNYKVLLTIVAPRPSTKGELAHSYLSSQNLPVFASMIHRYEVYPESQLQGVPITETTNSYKNVAWSDFESLGQEILNI